jgi:hypothetical protein
VRLSGLHTVKRDVSLIAMYSIALEALKPGGCGLADHGTYFLNG